jgi:hypothetical protein
MVPIAYPTKFWFVVSQMFHALFTIQEGAVHPEGPHEKVRGPG